MMTTGPEGDLPTLIAPQDCVNILRNISTHKICQLQTVVAHLKPFLSIISDTHNDGGQFITIRRQHISLGMSKALGLCVASLNFGNLRSNLVWMQCKPAHPTHWWQRNYCKLLEMSLKYSDPITCHETFVSVFCIAIITIKSVRAHMHTI